MFDWKRLVKRREAIRLLATLTVAKGAEALSLTTDWYPTAPGVSLLGVPLGSSEYSFASTAGLSEPVLPDPLEDFHGFKQHDLTVDGCAAHVVQPKEPLPGRRWVWRTEFWDAFPGADVAFLEAGFYVAYIEVGNTFGCRVRWSISMPFTRQ